MKLTPNDLKKRIAPLFQENFMRFGELGAAVSVWQNGKPIVDLYGGFRDARREKPWTARYARPRLVGDKGNRQRLRAACLAGDIRSTLTERVAEFWPQFAQAGKERITLAQLLSHQAGLCALDRRVDVLDYGAVIRALEEQKPLWPPGTAHGYHARTFGFLLDELVRRIAGKPLSEYWRGSFCASLSISIFGSVCPKKRILEWRRCMPQKAGKPPEPKQFYLDLNHARHAGAQNVHFPLRIARGQRDEQSLDPRAADCFLWRNRKRRGAGEILFHARERRRIRRPDISSHRETIAMDDNDTGRWHRPRLSNTDCVFRRLYERCAERERAEFSAHLECIWASWRGRQSRRSPIRKTKSRSLT